MEHEEIDYKKELEILEECIEYLDLWDSIEVARDAIMKESE